MILLLFVGSGITVPVSPATARIYHVPDEDRDMETVAGGGGRTYHVPDEDRRTGD